MKAIIVVPDGAPDDPVSELAGMTPLEAARTPHLDLLAGKGIVGRVQTIPQGLTPGSEVGNLSILGVDPRSVASGRAAWEALGRDVPLGPLDGVFRCNLVTLADRSGGYRISSWDDGLSLADHTAGGIDGEEACLLVESLNAAMGGARERFYPGVGYRHLLVVRGEGGWDLRAKPVAPHQILGQEMGPWLPADPHICEWIRESVRVLGAHPVNAERRRRGLRPANGIWLWGAGRREVLPSFFGRYGRTAAVISAVDLVNGIGRSMGMTAIEVPGATGRLDSNLRGKADAALQVLKKKDVVYIHVEAPDEASHQRRLKGKIEALERFDDELIGVLFEGLEGIDWRLLVVSDHSTSVTSGEHGAGPVPFLWVGGEGPSIGAGRRFTEAEALGSGIFIEEGTRLISLFMGGASPTALGRSLVRAGEER